MCKNKQASLSDVADCGFVSECIYLIWQPINVKNNSKVMLIDHWTVYRIALKSVKPVSAIEKDNAG